MIQRYICAGSVAAGRGVVLLSALINTLLGFVFLLVGTALFVFYTLAPPGTSLPQKGVELVAEDQILPYFVATQFPAIGLTGLILAGLFAAAMSTIDSGINGVTSVVVYDWLGGKEVPLRTSRVLTAALGSLVVVAAMLVPVLGNSVIDIVNTVAGTTLGMLLSVYFLGLLVPHANQEGALAGIAAGFVCVVLVWTCTEIPKWWLGAFAMVPAFVVGYFASIAFPAPGHAKLQGTLLRDILKQGES
jgi:Na+/proline symporter